MTRVNKAVTNTTHLVWIGRWAECVKGFSQRLHDDFGDGETYRFKSTRDLIDWLRYEEGTNQ